MLEFIFGRLLFGYGERVWGVLIAAAIVIFGCAGLYSYAGIAAEDGIAHGFGTCLYFSVVTFTTLGYGDLQPTEGVRVFAAGEALAGAALMALFIVIMARKYTR